MEGSKLRILFLIVILTSSPLLLTAQTRSFRWQEGQCEYVGTYDAQKYNLAKLKNTYSLVQGFQITATLNATVWKYEEIKNLPNIAGLDKEYELKSGELRNLDIVGTPYWQALKEKRLKELEQEYRLDKVTILAYQDPSVLKDYPYADSCVKTYASALITGGADLLAVWRQVSEDSRKRNGDPERLRRIFEQQNNSPDKYEYALVEVMSFGWFNCANGVRASSDPEELQKSFKKLFTRTRRSCEEP
jgi:hypothetical protein